MNVVLFPISLDALELNDIYYIPVKKFSKQAAVLIQLTRKFTGSFIL
jgi:hypothetical protein